MTKKNLPRTIPELRDQEELKEREFVIEVMAPMWNRGKKPNKSLRQMAAILDTNYETVRQLLIRYGVYE